jgi:hypothetical protein
MGSVVEEVVYAAEPPKGIGSEVGLDKPLNRIRLRSAVCSFYTSPHTTSTGYNVNYKQSK